MPRPLRKLFFDELCVSVTSCTPVSYDPRRLTSDIVKPATWLPLLVLGMALMSSGLRDVDSSSPAFIFATLGNFLLPFVLFAIHVAVIIVAAALQRMRLQRAGRESPVPTVTTLPYLTITSMVAAVWLEWSRLHHVGIAPDFLRLTVVWFVLTVTAEVFAAYLVTSVLSPGGAKNTGQAAPNPRAMAEAPSPPPTMPQVYLIVTGSRPRPFSPWEVLSFFQRPELIWPVLFVFLSIATGIIYALSLGGETYWPTVLSHLITSVTATLLGIFLYISIGRFLVRRREKTGAADQNIYIYSLSIVLPVCVFGAGLFELLQIWLRADASFNLARFASSAVFFTVIGEIQVWYLLAVAIPMVRAKSRSAPPQKRTSAPALPVMRQEVRIRDRAVFADELIMLSAEGNYVQVSCTTQSFVVPGPLFDVIEGMDFDDGLKVHRSTWVTIAACVKTRRDTKRRLWITLSDGTETGVSRAHEGAVKEAQQSALWGQQARLTKSTASE